MRLKVIVDRLILAKENLEYENGDEFDVSVERGIEILKATFNGKPVVEFVPNEEIPQTDSELVAEKVELENKVKELEEANEKLVAEKVELENKVKELEEANEKLVAEKADLANKKSTKKEGEDK